MSEPSFLKKLLRRVVQPVDKQRSAARQARNVITLFHALLSERGEVSGAALASEALAAYAALPENALAPFLNLLADEFSPAPAEIATAAANYELDHSAANLIALQQAVESPRQELIRRLNMAPGGTPVLVDIRRRLLRNLKSNPHWLAVDADFEHLLTAWFNRGFLHLKRIDWNTPAIILEKLIHYEAVHEIAGWTDLRRRLAADRRCFAFFHPALPEDPLIFIEVALTNRVSDAVQPLLDPNLVELSPTRADCAIFYSITNCQEGLRGISFGNLLIKQVVFELNREFPRLRTFATLSPVPGFMSWLVETQPQFDTLPQGLDATTLLKSLHDPDWRDKADLAARLKPVLMSLCAWYLTKARKNDEPRDAVARFHLGNGARMERLNWLADTSKRGLRNSAGIMVNYVYHLDDVERNHQAFVAEHRVAASHQITKLARGCGLSRASAK